MSILYMIKRFDFKTPLKTFTLNYQFILANYYGVQEARVSSDPTTCPLQLHPPHKLHWFMVAAHLGVCVQPPHN